MKLYHFLNSQYGLVAIRDQRYKVSTYQDLNDPFELFGPVMTDPEIRRTFEVAKNNIAKVMGLLCCSKSWNNSLLWGHYADRHKGMVLELEVPDEIVSHVEYVHRRPIITRVMMNGLGSDDPGHHDMMMSIILHTKAVGWAYENEARVQIDITRLKKTGELYFAPFDKEIKLIGIILGPLCKLSMEEIESALPIGKELLVRRAQIAFDSFDVIQDSEFVPRFVNGKA
jgi:hypothetical protein